MKAIHGTVIFKKKTPKGYLYILWDNEGEIRNLFSRNDDIVLFDSIDGLTRKGTTCDFLHNYSVITASALRNHPKNIIAASYFASLLTLFTETGETEQFLLDHITTILDSPAVSWEEIENVESAWIRIMGIGTADSINEKIMEQYAPRTLPIRETLKKNAKHITKGAVCNQEA